MKKTKARYPGDPSPAQQLDLILRVDHAGEFGAQRIYGGQLSILGTKPIAPTLRHMAKQEDAHLAAFEKALVERGARPTALYPLWHVLGFALGAVTARMSERAAMACTVAVEEVIDEHYQKQLDELDDAEPALRKTIARFRDEEIDHKNIGLKHGAEDATAYPLLHTLIRHGTQTAIWLSERV